MKLTNLKCQNAKPKDKKYKIFDGRGLFIEIRPNGAKYWRMKYNYLGKEKLMALGVYPEVSLSDARDKCIAARKKLDQNIDPMAAKQELKRLAKQNADNSFEVIARQWHDNFKHKWSERHSNTVLRRLEHDVFPEIGSMPIAEIKPAHLIDVLKKVQKRGAYEPAHRLRQYCSQVFRYAIIHEIAQINPAAEVGMVLKPVVKGHYAALDAKELPDFLDALNRNDARLHTDTRQATRLLMLTFVRTKELIEAKWNEFDLENAVWVIPAERMKMRNEHIVPLSTQALEILEDLKERNEKWDWVFPGHHSRRKHMSNNTILKGMWSHIFMLTISARLFMEQIAAAIRCGAGLAMHSVWERLQGA